MSLPNSAASDKTDSPPPVVSRLTGAGRSAVAVVAIRGAGAAEMLQRCFSPVSSGQFSPGQIRYGQWCSRQTDAISGESVVVTPIAANEFEIHCHGGPAAVERIEDDLRALGATVIASAHWISGDGSRSRLIREARSVLSACVTARTAAIAMDQVRGALLQWAQQLDQHLHDGSIDVATAHRQAAALLATAGFGGRLAQPLRVVLVGPPNVGKSSLLNAIVGYDRSITLDLAGTTRDVLHAETVIDGLPIRMSDTAGLRDSVEAIEREGIARARIAAEQADLIVWVSQPGLPAEPLPTARRCLQVLNKVDLLPSTATVADRPGDVIATNALTGEGIETLIAAIAAAVADEIPPPGAAVLLTARQTGLITRITQAADPHSINVLLDELIGMEPEESFT